MSKKKLANLIKEFMKGQCDGTYSEDTSSWSLDLVPTSDSPDPVGKFIELFSDWLQQRIIEEMIEQAVSETEYLKAIGWTQKDFAKALKQVLTGSEEDDSVTPSNNSAED